MTKQKNKSLVFRIVLFVFVGIVFGSLVYTIFAKNVMGNSMPMPFGFGVGVVETGSMEPDLNIGDVIVVKATDDIEVGDWVVFQEREMLVVHEVISINGDMLVTQGKANNAPDAPFDKKYVKGEVVHVFAGVGNLLRIVKSPAVAFAILALAGALLVLSYKKENQQQQQQHDQQLDQIRQEIKNLKDKQNITKNDK